MIFLKLDRELGVIIQERAEMSELLAGDVRTGRSHCRGLAGLGMCESGRPDHHQRQDCQHRTAMQDLSSHESWPSLMKNYGRMRKVQKACQTTVEGSIFNRAIALRGVAVIVRRAFDEQLTR